MTNLITSQQVVETLGLSTPSLRSSQQIAEALSLTNPHLFATQQIAEALSLTNPHLMASQLVVEVLVVNWNSQMLPIYPTLPGLTYDVKWTPQFFNMATATTDTGADVDLGLAEWPLHDFELTYSVLRDSFNGYVDPVYNGTEFRTMMGFFLMIGGTRGRFLFLNPDDYAVTGQAVGTTDGTTSTFTPLMRTFGVTGYNASEPVGVVNTAETVNVYLDGVLQNPSTYSIETGAPCNQQLKFTATPSSGQAITIDMQYYYYVKFPTDSNTFEKFMNQLWLLNKVVLHSGRPGA